MTATVAALLARQDVSTASFTATIAVDNNFLVLAAAGLVAADVACAAYNIYNAFEQGGFDEGCKQLGIEVVCYGAGLTVDKTPGLKVALGSCANELIILGEKYNKTTLAKGIARAEGTILNTQAQVFGGIGKAKDKIVDKAVQAKDKMLQQFSSSSHAQPGSILLPEKQAVKALLSAEEIAQANAVNSAVQAKDKVLKQIGLNGHDEMCAAARLSNDPAVREILAKQVDTEINQTCQVILKDGYYEVNDMKFTEYYYNRLWNKGRGVP